MKKHKEEKEKNDGRQENDRKRGQMGKQERGDSDGGRIENVGRETNKRREAENKKGKI